MRRWSFGCFGIFARMASSKSNTVNSAPEFCTMIEATTSRVPLGATLSAINLAAMPHAVDAHDADLVGNFVNHAVVAHTDAPVVLAASEFAAARRTRIVRQCLNRRDDAVVNLGRKTGEVFLCTAFKQDAIHGHLRLRPAR